MSAAWREAMRDLCGDLDLEHFDEHDYCLRHDVQVPTGEPCPIALEALGQLLTTAFQDGYTQAGRDAQHRAALPTRVPITRFDRAPLHVKYDHLEDQ